MTSRPNASFANLYNLPDPGDYFRLIAKTDYRLPAAMTRLLRALGAAIPAAGGPARLELVDFACGFGALGAMLRFDLDVGALAAGAAARRSAAPRSDAAAFVLSGVDIAPNALAYAAQAGFIDHGFCADLTAEALGPELGAALERCDAIVEIGAFHGVFARCLAPMLDAAGDRPLVLFSPRPDADPRAVRALLAARGYALLNWGGATLPYRRALDAAEEAELRANASAWSPEAAAQIQDGWIHNWVHVAVPRAHPWRSAVAAVCG